MGNRHTQQEKNDRHHQFMCVDVVSGLEQGPDRKDRRDERVAEKESMNLFLISMRDRAKTIEEQYELRQLTTRQALKKLQKLYEEEFKLQKEQQKKELLNLLRVADRKLG